MSKLNPKRIATGLKRAALNEKTKRSEKRLSTCKQCPFYQNGFCTDCGCLLIAKTKVMEEHCPQNNWEDTYLTDYGIAVINVSNDSVTMTQDKSSKAIVLTYSEKLTEDNKKIKLKIVNERQKYLDDPSKFDLEEFRVNLACGNCTGASNPPSKLKAEKDFLFTLWIKPTKVNGDFQKNVKLYSTKKGKEFNIRFILKGRK